MCIFYVPLLSNGLIVDGDVVEGGEFVFKGEAVGCFINFEVVFTQFWIQFYFFSLQQFIFKGSKLEKDKIWASTDDIRQFVLLLEDGEIVFGVQEEIAFEDSSFYFLGVVEKEGVYFKAVLRILALIVEVILSAEGSQQFFGGGEGVLYLWCLSYFCMFVWCLILVVFEVAFFIFFFADVLKFLLW